MKIVEIKDLEAGDEIIISCQSFFKYLKILRKPAFSTKTHWNTGNVLYKSVKCSTYRSEKQVSWTGYHGNTITRTKKTWEFGPENHNYNHYVDLEYRQIILVKKNND
jgi:hypothetical protein